MGWGEVPADETTTPGQVLWHSALEYHGQSPSDAVNTDRERAGSSCLCCEGPVKTFVCKATTTFEGEGWVTGDLEHEAVAGHERGDHRVEHVVKGVVPGHDGPHDAHGHPLHVHLFHHHERAHVAGLVLQIPKQRNTTGRGAKEEEAGD